MRKIAYETPHMDVVVLDEDVILTSTGTQCNLTDGCDGDLICGGYQVISGGTNCGVVSGGGGIACGNGG